jgi:hypothetical protein
MYDKLINPNGYSSNKKIINFSCFREKMGSLPQIVNEIWTALGDTGQTIRKSIVWFIDSVSCYARINTSVYIIMLFK